MGSHGHVLVLAARQPEFAALLEQAGYSVEARSRPLESADVEADVAVVFRGRLLGRRQAEQLTSAGIPTIEVLTVDPPSFSRAEWVRLSNRIPKPDLVQIVHAVAAWARDRVGAGLPAA